jgi:hypothetical protein
MTKVRKDWRAASSAIELLCVRQTVHLCCPAHSPRGTQEEPLFRLAQTTSSFRRLGAQ